MIQSPQFTQDVPTGFQVTLPPVNRDFAVADGHYEALRIQAICRQEAALDAFNMKDIFQNEFSIGVGSGLDPTPDGTLAQDS